jgi:Tfp pilus assembly protein PilP
MTRMIIMGIVTIGCVAGIATPLRARILSDMTLETFRKGEVAPEEEGVESPFVPKKEVQEDVVVEDLKLSGIAIGDAESFALIGGHAVRVGDRLGGFRVRQIGKDHVVLQRLDRRVILRFEGGW